MNLCIGTLSSFINGRPDLSALVDDLMEFKLCGDFMLTEIGHGLDARNLETTATLLPDGYFDLHTPNPSAAKAMPPSTPQCGVPRVAIVFARLITDGMDYGVKPFLVRIADGEAMHRGITSRALPTRPGTKPLDHAITSFDHVRLPPTALHGSSAKPRDSRADFFKQIWRVPVGTLSLCIAMVAPIKVASEITARYSQRRLTAASDDGARIPILAFSTQQRPILRGFTNAIILDAFGRWTIKGFMDPSHSPLVRHALAIVFKVTTVQAMKILNEFSERCGWQGLFAYNQLSEIELSVKGNCIAEGETLVLCIRESPTSTAWYAHSQPC